MPRQTNPARQAELIRQVAQGDRNAFESLYDELSGMVFGVVRRVLRDPAQSEEVTQEVFLELWRTAPRFDAERGTVRAYTLTMAHRRAVDRVRSEQASRDRVQADGHSIRVPAAGPDELMIDRADRARVVEALDGLTDLQRESIELAYYKGMTHTEIAAGLDVPLGTVKTRIRDGLQRLRTTMDSVT